MGDSAVERLCDDIRRLASDCLAVERSLGADHAPTGLQPGVPQMLPTAVDGVSAMPCSHESIANLFPEAERIRELACELRRTCERIVIDRFPSNTGTISQHIQGQPTILVVDDIADTRDLLTVILQRAGFAVITAPNGLEGLVAAHSIRPSLILMDIQMPILNGIEATRLLKAMAATRHIPVVAHTSQPASCHVPPGVLFAHILPKPVIPDVLLALTQRYIPDVNGAA